jgi:lambda family phage portal protein
MARSISKSKALGGAAAQAAIDVAQAALPAITGLPAVVGNTFIAPMKAGFQDATAGGEPRMAWARSNVGGGALGWNGSGGVFYSANGGRVARDAVKASDVSNDLATSNPIIATLILNFVTQAIGTGLTLSSKPDASELGITPEEARALSHKIETRWSRWASNPRECDYAGRFDLHSMASCVFRSALLNGESIIALEWRLFRDSETYTKVNILDTLQLDRAVTRTEPGVNIYSGVGFTPEGRLAGYMLRQIPLGAFATAPAAAYYPAATSWGRIRILHIIADFIDPRQTRGLSPLVGGLTPAHESETLGEFALGKAMLENQFAITVESALPTRVALDGLQVNEHAGNTENWLSEREELYGKAKVTPQVGTINHLAPGDALRFHRSETPNTTFDAFNKSLVRKAAKAAGSAVEDVSGDYSQTSFSASRLAMALPHEINLRRRKDIAERFYRAVFEAWLEEQIERGLIDVPAHAAPFWKAKAAYCNGRFLGKGIVSPDPKKTTEAQLLRLENGLATFTELLAEDGKDLEAHIAVLVEERELLAKHGLNHAFFAGQTTTQNRNEDVTEEPPARIPAAKPKRAQAQTRAPRLKTVRVEPRDMAAIRELAEHDIDFDILEIAR